MYVFGHQTGALCRGEVTSPLLMYAPDIVARNKYEYGVDLVSLRLIGEGNAVTCINLAVQTSLFPIGTDVREIFLINGASQGIHHVLPVTPHLQP